MRSGSSHYLKLYVRFYFAVFFFSGQLPRTLEHISLAMSEQMHVYSPPRLYTTLTLHSVYFHMYVYFVQKPHSPGK